MAQSLSAAASPASVSSKPVLPVVYLWVKQGKTDHMATLEDPATISLYYEHQHQQQKQGLTNKNKNKNLDDEDDDDEEEEDASRNNSTNTYVNTNIADLFGLDPETEVRIRWSFSNQRDIVDASEIRIRDLEREGRGSERGGRPSRNVTRNATKTSAITRTTRQLQRSEKPVEKRRPKKRKNRRPKKRGRKKCDTATAATPIAAAKQEQEPAETTTTSQERADEGDEPYRIVARKETATEQQSPGQKESTDQSIANSNSNNNSSSSSSNKNSTARELFTKHNPSKHGTIANEYPQPSETTADDQSQQEQPQQEQPQQEQFQQQKQPPQKPHPQSKGEQPQPQNQQQLELEQQHKINLLLEEDFDSSDDEAIVYRMELMRAKKALADGTATVSTLTMPTRFSRLSETRPVLVDVDPSPN